MPLGWCVCRWESAFAVGMVRLPLGIMHLPLGIVRLPLGWCVCRWAKKNTRNPINFLGSGSQKKQISLRVGHEYTENPTDFFVDGPGKYGKS